MPESTRGGAEPARSPRILVIDDSSDDRLLIRRALEQSYEDPVIVEVDSAEAFEGVLGEPFDAVISDFHLGWSDGLTLLERIRRVSPYTAAIIFTGTGTEEVAVRAMKDGIDDYVVKATQHYKRLPLAIRRAVERQRQRLALTSAETEIRDLLERLPAGIYRSAVEGGLLYGNPALREILGVTDARELIGTDLTSRYVTPQERVDWIRRLEEEVVVSEEFQLREMHGEPVWIRDHARLVRTPGGASKFIEGVVEDVTERRLAEAAVEKQARLITLLQSVTALANEISDFHEALEAALGPICSTTGYTLGHAFSAGVDGELTPSGIWTYTGGHDFSAYERDTRERAPAVIADGLIGRVYRSATPEWIEDLRAESGFLRAGSAIASGLLSAVAVPVIAGAETVAVFELLAPAPRPRDPDLLEALRQAGVQLGRVAERQRAARDRRRIEQKVRQSQKMEAVGRLAGGIAHDFNNLVTVLLMETRAAQEVDGVPGAVRESLHAIFDTSERAALLTRQLLSFSKGRPHAPAAVRVREVVDELRPMLERILGERYRLETTVSSDPLTVKIDRVELDQVLLNLVVNARDAMPDGGEITIEATRRDMELGSGHSTGRVDCVVLSVTDEGTGIPKQIQDSIFEPFYSTKGEAGTGLGLSISYGIVSTSGGDLRVYSEEGIGSTFSVVLPVVGPDAARPEEPSDHHVPTGTETILIVEDDLAVRNVTARALQAQGYTTVEAPDAESALELLADAGHGRPVDLVVSDVVLPGMGGPDLVGRIREAFPHMPVILTSGYSEEIVKRHGGLDEPGSAIVQKPFSVAELARTVRRLLDEATEARDDIA